MEIGTKKQPNIIIFILGLDGLEHDFVENWRLTNLKQRQHGRLTVPISKKRAQPITPEVWAAFLTGKHTYETFENTYPQRATVLKLLEPILKPIHKRTHLSLGISKKLKHDLLKTRWRTFKGGILPLKVHTFLDVTNSTEINAPYYSFDKTVVGITHRFGVGKLSLEQAVSELKALYVKRKAQILNATEKLYTYDLAFAYMHFPDILQHFLSKRPHEIKRHYLDLDKYVATLKTRLGAGTLFIIVSDHGFNLDTEMHSNHGFYSSSAELHPKPRRITDFYKIVVTQLT